MTALSYKDVLTCKTWLGDIAKMFEFARQLGYEYFLWNDRVYRIIPKLGGKPEVIDTNLTVENVE
jgi:hypothetical protein